MSQDTDTVTETELQLWVREVLKDPNANVTLKFRKVDGSIRVMHATLDPALMISSTPQTPRAEELKTKTVRVTNPNVCFVWDKEVGSWQCFRWYELLEVSTGNETRNVEGLIPMLHW